MPKEAASTGFTMRTLDSPTGSWISDLCDRKAAVSSPENLKAFVSHTIYRHIQALALVHEAFLLDTPNASEQSLGRRSKALER